MARPRPRPPPVTSATRVAIASRYHVGAVWQLWRRRPGRRRTVGSGRLGAEQEEHRPGVALVGIVQAPHARRRAAARRRRRSRRGAAGGHHGEEYENDDVAQTYHRGILSSDRTARKVYIATRCREAASGPPRATPSRGCARA